jgi:hypothetical protein
MPDQFYRIQRGRVMLTLICKTRTKGRAIALSVFSILTSLAITSQPNSAIAAESQPAISAETKPAHNLAEGDNPALDERALQAERTGTNSGTQKSNEQKKETNSTDTKSGASQANWSGLDNLVEKLIREYYPKAKLKSGKENLYVEYKAKPFILPSTNKQEQGPDWGGVVIDMELQKGPYAGVHQVPKKFNEYSFYSVELYAPYSPKYDCHLLTRICYPFDVPQEFLKRFKKVVEDFEQYL